MLDEPSSEGSFNKNSSDLINNELINLKNDEITFPDVIKREFVQNYVDNAKFINEDGICNLPPNVKTIDDNAFVRVSNINQLIADNIDIIGKNSFEESSIITAKVSNASIISKYAFLNCKRLTAISCEKAKKIRSSAFEECTSLSAVECEKVEKISKNAFKNCYLLEKIKCNNAKLI